MTLYFDPASIHAALGRSGFFDDARAGRVELSHSSREHAIAWRTPKDQPDGPAHSVDLGTFDYYGLRVRLVEWRAGSSAGASRHE